MASFPNSGCAVADDISCGPWSSTTLPHVNRRGSREYLASTRPTAASATGTRSESLPTATALPATSGTRVGYRDSLASHPRQAATPSPTTATASPATSDTRVGYRDSLTSHPRHPRGPPRQRRRRAAAADYRRHPYARRIFAAVRVRDVDPPQPRKVNGMSLRDRTKNRSFSAQRPATLIVKHEPASCRSCSGHRGSHAGRPVV